MRRKISNSLVEWKNDTKRMPLIINGARQVGKTYIVEQFGSEHYESLLYLNMEIETNLCEFLETELSPKKIIQYLYEHRDILPKMEEACLASIKDLNLDNYCQKIITLVNENPE